MLERGYRGFSREDVWSFDHYLAGVIAGGLRELSENLHGCPPELCENGDVDLGVRRWQEILVEMALGFQKYHDDEAREHDHSLELDRSFDLLRKWWGHIWD